MSWNEIPRRNVALGLGVVALFFATRAGRAKPAEELRAHPVRACILKHIEEKPGASVTELARSLGKGWGTIEHHLHFLRRAQLLQDVWTLGEHRYFANPFDEAAMKRIAVLRHGRVLEVTRAVLEDPGIVHLNVARRTSISRKVVRALVTALREVGLVAERRDRQGCHVFPTTILQELESDLQSRLGGSERPAKTDSDCAGPAGSSPRSEPRTPIR